MIKCFKILQIPSFWFCWWNLESDYRVKIYFFWMTGFFTHRTLGIESVLQSSLQAEQWLTILRVTSIVTVKQLLYTSSEKLFKSIYVVQIIYFIPLEHLWQFAFSGLWKRSIVEYWWITKLTKWVGIPVWKKKITVTSLIYSWIFGNGPKPKLVQEFELWKIWGICWT